MPDIAHPYLSLIASVAVGLLVGLERGWTQRDLSLAARWALEHFGQEGMALVLTLTGISDVDAAVMTMAGLPPHAIGDRTAGFVLGARSSLTLWRKPSLLWSSVGVMAA